MQLHCNHNRNLKISIALFKSQAHRGTSLFTQRIKGGFPKGGQEKPRSDFQNTRRGQSSRSDGEGEIVHQTQLLCIVFNWYCIKYSCIKCNSIVYFSECNCNVSNACSCIAL